ncbi:class I SAM-dependent methyltransferase [Streptomyces cinnabarinus]|uniref:Class I SAM-dependent methyltransferase n=1 Tax=Streptomyces cinnabarinus TaxID=67287 RepID=A0ABY7KRC0_9ACTN|nr:class I SAM-dependent methyltransferase [Streptomyces cinnabarinus]WAZ26088.1 class I SAM-dependent methyltransferase [Streptomyces cinnabarinus]
MAAAVPRRVERAVALLDVGPADRVLEIGCGGGVAVQLVCELLETGSITAVDRSATAVARALSRNAALVEEGRAALARIPFTAAELAAEGLSDRSFDKIFAVNVNLFWTGPARAELALAASLLAPGGALYAFYETPAGREQEVVEKATGAFEAAGFTTEVIRSAPVVAIVGRP